MQLLEMIAKSTKSLTIILLISGDASADLLCNGEQTSNKEIITCSQSAFDRIDKLINEQYKELINSHSGIQKKSIITSQRTWIKLKEEYCNSVYDSVYPGKEAPLDRLSCLIQVTSSRVSEIIYLRTGVLNDGFGKAVSIVNSKFTNYQYEKAQDIVGGQESYGETWSSYANENCKISNNLYGEEINNCIARMRFQMPIN